MAIETKPSISISGLKKLFSSSTADTNGGSTSNFLTSNPVKRFSRKEISRTIMGELVPSEVKGQESIGGIISYINPVHTNIAKIRHEAENLIQLAPEIKQASAIYCSSILSPNDMQQAKIGVAITRTKNAINSDVIKKIEQTISNYFNNEFRLGQQMSKWIDQALFKSGSQPLLILPRKTLHNLVKRSTISMEDYITEFLNITDDPLGFKKSDVALEDFVVKARDKTFFSDEEYNEIYNDLIPAIEAYNSSIGRNSNSSEITEDNFKDAVNKITQKTLNELQAGDFIRFTSNPQVIKMGEDILKEKRNQYSKDVYRLFTNGTMQFEIEEAIGINDSSEVDLNSISRPIFMTLPPESTIPLCVPGAKEQHIGYFIVLDEMGCPIEITKQQYLTWFDSGINNSKDADAAFFGTNNTIFGAQNRTNIARVTARRVFDTVLDKYVASQLNQVGMQGVDSSKINAISACMFQRLLSRKRTQIVFVPEPMVTYFCYDYREDGTGKSLLEDMMFVLSLRTTLLVSKIMAATNDAIDHRNIEITFDKKQENIEQLMHLITQTYVENKRLKFSTNPNEIVRDIATQSLSVFPKNYPGLEGLDITTPESGSSRSSIKPDDELLDQLTNMFISGLVIPHAALNMTSENEYSRSVATANLFFAKECMSKQEITNKHGSKFIRNYVKSDEYLINEILEILESSFSYVHKKDDAYPDNEGSVVVNDGAVNVEEDQINNIQNNHTRSLIQDILDHLTMTLPTPNVAVDKAQYNEFNDFMSAVDTILGALYANELIPAADNESAEFMTTIKAHIKMNLLKTFLSNVSFTTNMEIPDLEEVCNSDSFKDIYQLVLNAKSGIEKTKKVLVDDAAENTKAIDNAENGEDGNKASDDDYSSDSFTGF